MLQRLAFLCLLAVATAAAQVSVLNGASFRPEVAAGAWATAFGTFGTVANTTASAFPLPKTLNGVSVTIAGAEAPVYFVSATQVNFLVPYATQPGVHPVVVRTAASTFNGTARVISAAPGLFVQDAAAPPKGAILNQNNSLNTASNAARRGEVVQLFGTAPGATSTVPVDGAAVGSDPLVTSRSTPQVFIGGVEAQVQFSGLTPGQTSLWQVNAIVPNQPFLTGRVPVVVFIDGVDSNEVGLFVQ